MILSGAVSLIGSVFAYLYEGSYGTEYYLEEYGTGLFSNFDGMVSLCKWLGIILIVAGFVIWYIGKVTEGPELAKLKEMRDKKLDGW